MRVGEPGAHTPGGGGLRPLWVRGGARACALASAGLLHTATPLAFSLNPVRMHAMCFQAAYGHECTATNCAPLSKSSYMHCGTTIVQDRFATTTYQNAKQWLSHLAMYYVSFLAAYSGNVRPVVAV